MAGATASSLPAAISGKRSESRLSRMVGLGGVAWANLIRLALESGLSGGSLSRGMLPPGMCVAGMLPAGMLPAGTSVEDV